MNDPSAPLFAGTINKVPEQPRVNQAPIMMNNSVTLGPANTQVACPFCYASVKTSIKHTVTTRTHILSLLCCWIMCCCLPYCMNSAQNTDHYCPNCNKYLGTYKK